MSEKFIIMIEKVIRFLFEKILHIFLSKEKYDVLMQFVKFGIVGLSNTVISYGIYVVVMLGLQSIRAFPSVDYLFAQLVAFLLSVLWSFYWNQRFVFKADQGKRNLLHALLKTYLSYAFTGLFLNSILSVIWVEIFHWSKMFAPIINLLISVPLNFILNKFWAFK